jgi:hypothetical protein
MRGQHETGAKLHSSIKPPQISPYDYNITTFVTFLHLGPLNFTIMFLQQLSWIYVLPALFLTFYLQVWIRRAKSNHDLKALGGRAPFVQTRLPLGLLHLM